MRVLRGRVPSLRAKITIICMATTVFALIVTTGIVYVHVTLVGRRNCVEELTSMARLVGMSSTAALKFSDTETAMRLLSSLGHDPEIREAGLFGKDGHLLAAFSPGREGRPEATVLLPAETGASLTADSLTVRESVFLNGERIGDIVIVSGIDTFRDAMVSNAFLLLAVVVVASLLAYFLSRRLRNEIIRPLASLSQMMGDIADRGDYSVRVALEAGNEVGKLAENFNVMLDQIEKRDGTLNEAQQSLRRYGDRLGAMSSALETAQEEERRRLASDLHDSVCQTLWGVNLQTAMLRKKKLVPDARDIIDNLQHLVQQAMKEAYNLTFELSPKDLYEVGLADALRDLTSRAQSLMDIPVSFRDDTGAPALDEHRRIVVYRAAQEFLVNVGKHAKAKSVDVALSRRNGSIELVVQDDGIGFSVSAMMAEDRVDGGFGLMNVRERVRRAGGTVDIIAEPGIGARFCVLMPLEGSADHDVGAIDGEEMPRAVKEN